MLNIYAIHFPVIYPTPVMKRNIDDVVCMVCVPAAATKPGDFEKNHDQNERSCDMETAKSNSFVERLDS